MKLEELKIRLQVRIDTLQAITYNSTSDTDNDGVVGALLACLLDVQSDVGDVDLTARLEGGVGQVVMYSEDDRDRIADLLGRQSKSNTEADAIDFDPLYELLEGSRNRGAKALEILKFQDPSSEEFQDIIQTPPKDIIKAFQEVLRLALVEITKIKEQVNPNE
jgi:hypothetical protein